MAGKEIELPPGVTRDPSLFEAALLTAETAESQRDRARRWAKAWRAAAYDFHTAHGLASDRAGAIREQMCRGQDALEQAERELAAEREECASLLARLERLEAALWNSARAWHDDVCPRRDREDFEHCEGQWCQTAREALEGEQ